MCNFIHTERAFRTKWCSFYESGCKNCNLVATKVAGFVFTLCIECSKTINEVRKNKYMLYFHEKKKNTRKKDISFAVDCSNCQMTTKIIDNCLEITVRFCKNCTSIFTFIVQGRNVLYFL